MSHTFDFRKVFSVLVIILLVAVMAPAQEKLDKKISEIRVQGNARVPTEMILTYVTLEKGDTFDPRIARNDFQALWNTELFSDIEILEEDAADGGLILIIKVEERPKIRKILYEGLDAITASKIEEKMQEPPNDLAIPEGSVLSYAKLTELAKIINSLMAEAGLEFGEVTWELRPVNNFEVDVAFLVNEGGKVKISEVRFVGNENFSQWQLTKVLEKSRPTWLLSWLQKDNIYSSKLLSEDLDRLREFYAEQGYLRVSIKDPVVETIEDDPLLSRRDMRARLTIPVKEGIRYRINTISFEGVTMLSNNALMALLNIKEGSFYNKAKIEDGTKNIGKIYKNQGYINVFLDPLISYPKDKTGYVDLKFVVTEGEPFFIRKINFTGNKTTRDKVLRRNIYLTEESPFDFQALEDSMRRLNQLGFFGSITPNFNFDQENKQVDIDFDVTEIGRNQIQFGGGYSGYEGLFYNVSFRTQNFWGQGQTLSFMMQNGDRNKNYEVSFFEPWLFDKPIGAGLTFFSRKWEFADFVRRGDGGRVNTSFRLGRFISLFTEYRYELIDIQNPEGSVYGNSIYYPEGQQATGSITPTIVRNTIDNPLLPTRGHKDLIRLEYGSELLGGDFSFYKFVGEHISNFPITRNNVFRFRVQVGYADTMDDQYELPIFERFFMGGENTLRGYGLRTIGPRDEFGRIVGGEKSFLINIENNFLLTNELRLVPFFDAGNTFDDKIDFNDLYMSAGVELRFFMPMMNIPLRFIYSKPINPEDFHKTNSFQFTIGQIF